MHQEGFMTLFTISHYWFTYLEPDESFETLTLFSLTSVLILSCHLNLDLRDGHVFSGQNYFMFVISSTTRVRYRGVIYYV